MKIEELKKKVSDGADSFSPVPERVGSYSQSPHREWETTPADGLELSQIRNQLNESKNNMTALQAELNQTAESTRLFIFKSSSSAGRVGFAAKTRPIKAIGCYKPRLCYQKSSSASNSSKPCSQTITRSCSSQ